VPVSWRGAWRTRRERWSVPASPSPEAAPCGCHAPRDPPARGRELHPYCQTSVRRIVNLVVCCMQGCDARHRPLLQPVRRPAPSPVVPISQLPLSPHLRATANREHALVSLPCPAPALSRWLCLRIIKSAASIQQHASRWLARSVWIRDSSGKFIFCGPYVTQKNFVTNSTRALSSMCLLAVHACIWRVLLILLRKQPTGPQQWVLLLKPAACNLHYPVNLPVICEWPVGLTV
jgi:hypothetical protein